MAIAFSPPWRHLTFMSPLSESRADRLVAFLKAGDPRSVIDLGCGWAELLLRVVASTEATGVGIDTDPEAIAHGLELAMRRGLSTRVTLQVADALGADRPFVDAAVCIGATHAIAPPQEPNDRLRYSEAFVHLRSLLPKGGRLVYGDGVWRSAPTAAAIDALGGRDDEMVDVATLVRLATDAGFAVVAFHEATTDEWDAFESGYGARYAEWLTDHEHDHPDGPDVRRLAEEQRRRYLEGYREVLGLAYLELIAI